MVIQPATRKDLKLRLFLHGPAKSGKTYSALLLAHELAGNDGRIAVVDTEHGSAQKYLGAAPHGKPWAWSVCELRDYAPKSYVDAIHAIGRERFGVLVIDSISHAWNGPGGALEQVDKCADRTPFGGWRKVGPQLAALTESILAYPGHVIVTARSKTRWVIERSPTGRAEPRKIGTKPVFRDGLEYEFDVVCELDLAHTLRVTGSRCPSIDGKVYPRPGPEFAAPILAWLAAGAVPAAAGEPAAPVPGIVLDAPAADKSLVLEIKRAARSAGWDAARLKAEVAERGAERLADLPAGDAAALLRAIHGEHLGEEVDSFCRAGLGEPAAAGA